LYSVKLSKQRVPSPVIPIYLELLSTCVYYAFGGTGFSLYGADTMSGKIYDIRAGYVPEAYRQPATTGDLGPSGCPGVASSALSTPAAPAAPATAPAAPAVEAGPVGAPEWAARLSRNNGKKGAPIKYPFDTMPVNGTFRVPPEIKRPSWLSFRVYCSKKSAQLNKKFHCHQHPDGTFEVWRQR
jgi:hypothetical protein